MHLTASCEPSVEAGQSNSRETDSPKGSLPGLSHGDLLRRKVRLASGELYSALDRFWSQTDVGARYPELLFHIHCVVRATFPAMEAAGRIAEARSASDPVAAAVAAYLARHIPEELHRRLAR